VVVPFVLLSCGQPTTVVGNADQIFQQAKSSTMKDAAFTMDTKLHASAPGANLSIHVSGQGELVVQSSAYHLTVKTEVGGPDVSGNFSSEIFQVSDKQYMRVDSHLVQMDSTVKFEAVDLPNAEAWMLPQNLDNLKQVGEETVHSDKCWHLTGTKSFNPQGTPVPNGASGSTAVTFDLWIRESDSYYVRVKMNTLPGGLLPLGGDSISASTDLDVTLDFSDYNKGRTVTAPPADQVAG
jgi:hypothetical protein